MKIKYTKEFRNFMESPQVKQVDLKTDENINYNEIEDKNEDEPEVPKKT